MDFLILMALIFAVAWMIVKRMDDTHIPYEDRKDAEKNLADDDDSSKM